MELHPTQEPRKQRNQAVGAETAYRMEKMFRMSTKQVLTPRTWKLQNLSQNKLAPNQTKQKHSQLRNGH